MTYDGITNDKDRRFVRRVVVAVFACWFLVCLLPLLAIRTSLFKTETKEEVARVQSVLQQLGTFGDLFGLLNCLFSGLALIGVAYAIVLQRRDLLNQQADTHRNARATELQN